MPTVEYREDGALDAEYGRVQVLAIAVDVELHVVVTEPDHVALLDQRAYFVLLKRSITGNLFYVCMLNLSYYFAYKVFIKFIRFPSN